MEIVGCGPVGDESTDFWAESLILSSLMHSTYNYNINPSEGGDILTT